MGIPVQHKTIDQGSPSRGPLPDCGLLETRLWERWASMHMWRSPLMSSGQARMHKAPFVWAESACVSGEHLHKCATLHSFEWSFAHKRPKLVEVELHTQVQAPTTQAPTTRVSGTSRASACCSHEWSFVGDCKHHLMDHSICASGGCTCACHSHIWSCARACVSAIHTHTPCQVGHQAGKIGGRCYK